MKIGIRGFFNMRNSDIIFQNGSSQKGLLLVGGFMTCLFTPSISKYNFQISIATINSDLKIRSVLSKININRYDNETIKNQKTIENNEFQKWKILKIK